MPVHTVFTDDDLNELSIFINSEEKIYIGINHTDTEFSLSVLLDAHDAKLLAKVLNNLAKDISSVE